MTLTFPTVAERVLGAWKSDRSTALVLVCEREGGTRHDEGGVIVFNFDDDSNIEIVGRGSSHKARATLP